MSFCKLEAKKLFFSYGREPILKGLDLEVEGQEVLVIKGPNGSGKSTLLKILTGILAPDSGQIEYFFNGNKLKNFDFYHFFGFCSVEQNLYEELTVFENLYFLLKIRGIEDKERIKNYLIMAKMEQAKNKYFKNLSSGMRQKTKLISAIIHKPVFLFLDEPGTNLDEGGYLFLSQIIEEQKGRGICLIASNNKREFEYGNREIELGR
ncbi:MAG: ABC transporter ATP-binding protein [Thermoanaerobaculia bacterium]